MVFPVLYKRAARRDSKQRKKERMLPPSAAPASSDGAAAGAIFTSASLTTAAEALMGDALKGFTDRLLVLGFLGAGVLCGLVSFRLRFRTVLSKAQVQVVPSPPAQAGANEGSRVRISSD